MPDAQNPAQPEPVTEPSKETTDEQTHPWGEDFDAATAWRALTSARDAEKAAKAETAAFKKAEQEKADAELTELEKLRKDFAELNAEKTALARTTQLNELGLDKALHGFISGETPDAIAEQVAALKAALGTGKPAEEDPAPEPPATRPKPQLTPGQGGDDKSETDLDALVKSLL
ncbi:hypothetical protein J2Y69_003335 [Microbacterium resistens]|uniref:Scaffolding protein n=1 Tax=Microbacterium resistens TaxID=156977 RepID=A0ABU1SGH6_9MICO|nr:hypothetical protein [Microbacterium resistens]MDR6868711.1 hypothetical protein [Microbacterium resistens]